MRVVHTVQWSALLQRAVKIAAELSDLVGQKIGVVADPRARLVRRQRRARRWGLIFGIGCLFWTLVTTLLATWSTPVWGLLITGVLAAGSAGPATLLLLRYRWLRSQPLPAQNPGSCRRLPPTGSAARTAMLALGTSERGFFSLLGVMERGNLLPTTEIRELTDAANRTAAAMAVTAAEVVSMERTVKLTPQSGPYLVPTINAFTGQLSCGVRQYNEMVTAAAQLVSSANAVTAPGVSVAQQRYRDELVGATDRLLGWARAFDELGRAPGS
ncbi:MAG: hypothetical protein K2Q25_03840 [Mycobacteriaceae bacterium]|nr:hypothetical protein [Mycobacteriaceae bacterium]